MENIVKVIWLIIFILLGIINLYVGTWWGALISFLAVLVVILTGDN